MRKRNWSLFAVLAALAALAALSVGSAGSAVAASASASGASASGGEQAVAARRRGRRGPRGRRGRRGARGVAGATGAPGPQGPPGQSSTTPTGGGWTKIFYAVNGVGPTVTLIDANGLNFQTSCSGNDMTPEFRTSFDNSVIRGMSIEDDGGGDDEEYDSNDDFDIGEAFSETGANNTRGDGFEDDEILHDIIFANPVGTLVKVNVTMHADSANALFNSTDCAIFGGYFAA